MNAKGIILATSLLSMGALALPSGCGSSSSGGSSQADAATDDSSGDDGAASNSCSPIMGAMCAPGIGLTCCVNAGGLAGLAGGGAGGGGAGGLTSLGMCVAPSTCTSMIQYQCMVPSDCAAGQACCGGVGGDAGALLAALADAGDASFDAAALMAAADGGGGLAGLGGALTGLSIQSFCQSSCMAAQQQLCSSDSDCKSAGTNSVCAPASLAALGGGAGAFGSLIGNFIMIKTCQPPEGGTGTEGGTSSEAGGADSGGSNDGSSTESGSTEAGGSDGSGD